MGKSSNNRRDYFYGEQVFKNLKSENEKELMKKVILFIAALVLFGTSGFAADNYTGQYKKKKGEVNIQLISDKEIKFWINTAVGMHPCNIGDEGNAVATFVDKNRAAFSGDEKCVVVLGWGKTNLKLPARTVMDTVAHRQRAA